jgi:MFS family permease
MRKISPKRELDILRMQSFLFGFGVMAWVPRFPELKAHLHLSNGQFGSIASTGSIGSLIALVTVGHVIRRFGNRIVYNISIFSVMACLLILVHTGSTAIFLPVNILYGSAISCFVIANQTQMFHLQNRTGKIHMTHLSGMWSAGALVTALLAGVLVGRVSLSVHVSVLAVLVFSIMLYGVFLLGPELVGPDSSSEAVTSVRSLVSNFHFDKIVAWGLLLACYFEFAVGDWVTIFTKDTLGFNTGLNTIPFISCMIAMILGRLTIHRLFDNHSIEKLVKLGSLGAGAGSVLGFAAAMILGEKHSVIALIILSAGLFISGLGSSFVGPVFTNAANTRSSSPASVVMAEVAFANVILVFITKWIVAWTAQVLSLGVALFIPAAMLLFVPYFAHAVIVKKD